MQTINVTECVAGKFGPQLKDDKGNYYSFSKFYKGATSVPSGSYEVDLFVSQKGNRYINAIQGQQAVEAPAEAPKPKGRPKKTETEVHGEVVTVPKNFVKPVTMGVGRDFDKENFGKVKSLFLESLMPMLVTDAHDDEEVKKVVRKWALYCFEDDR